MRTVEQLPEACLYAGAQMLRATKALVLADEGEARGVIRVHDDLTVRTVEAETSALQLLVSAPGAAMSLVGDDQVEDGHPTQPERLGDLRRQLGRWQTPHADPNADAEKSRSPPGRS